MSKGKLRNYEPEAQPDPVAESIKRLSVSIAQVDSALARAETWAQSLDHSYKDEELRQIADEFFENVSAVVVRNCLRVYLARTEADSDEARAESEYLESLESLSEEDVERAITATAKSLSDARYIDKAPEHYRYEAHDLLFRLNRNLMYVALLKTEEGPVSDSVWYGALQKNLAFERNSDDYKHLYELQVLQMAKHLLETNFKPTEMPFKSLRTFSGVLWLESKGKKKLFKQNGVAAHMLATVNPRIDDPYIRAFSMMPSQTIDRAARGSSGWAFPSDDAPTFSDANNRHAVTYFADGLTQEVLREGVMQLNPRTADVWRLCTAALLEGWGRGEKEAPHVSIDARQLCDAMGFAKHHNGGHFPQNVEIAAQALVDLERFYITIPHGTKHYPEDPTTGRRKKISVEARDQQRVLIVSGKKQAREVSEGKWMTLQWTITAGEWIKAYPREQFAPLFRALVELPGTYTPDLWAKAIGTELVWQYRMDKGREKVQRVETMLKQACVLEEARGGKNKKRVRDYFEKAMDKLQETGVCAAWEYNAADFDQVEATTRGWFGVWLQARVVVTPPADVVRVMGQIAKVEEKHVQRAAKISGRRSKVNLP